MHASFRRAPRRAVWLGFLVGLGAAALPVAAAGPGALIRLQPLVTGLSAPVHLTHAGDGSGRLFVVEQAGVVRIIRNGRLLPRPFLDIRRLVISGGEMGLLSVAFHPQYATNGRFFVNYTADGRSLRTVVAEYRVSSRDPNLADPAERVLLEIAQPFRNHNGGLNLFGPEACSTSAWETAAPVGIP